MNFVEQAVRKLYAQQHLKPSVKVVVILFAAFGFILANYRFIPVARAQTSVTIRDLATGATLKLTSNAEGRFTAAFLKPDDFEVSATAPGLQSTAMTVQVLVGQQSAVNVKVTPTASQQTAQVSAGTAQLVDTQTSQRRKATGLGKADGGNRDIRNPAGWPK